MKLQDASGHGRDINLVFLNGILHVSSSGKPQPRPVLQELLRAQDLNTSPNNGVALGHASGDPRFDFRFKPCHPIRANLNAAWEFALLLQAQDVLRRIGHHLAKFALGNKAFRSRRHVDAL